jgi:hypothetical protein
LKRLQVLNLASTRVSDAGLKVLAGFPQLGRLHLAGSRVTAKGAADLRKALPRVQISRWQETGSPFGYFPGSGKGKQPQRISRLKGAHLPYFSLFFTFLLFP